MKDLFGQALLDYYNGNYTEDLVTSTNISDEDILPLPYLFRDFYAMPAVEQRALELCDGKILDVGCGAGNHSLWLQEKGYNVKAIDSSVGAVKVCNNRGVKNAQLLHLLNETESFDTILLLMNGTGIFQSLNQVPKYLNHLKTLLNPNGKILIDSSDIKYMYLSESELDDPKKINELNQYNQGNYYGELDYYLYYKRKKEDPMKWLYLGFDTLKDYCTLAHLNCELVIKGAHHDFLAKITHKSV